MSAVKKGYDYQILPPELRFSKEEAEELLDFLRNKSERLFVYTGLVYTWADRLEELYGVKLRLIDDDAPDANYNFSFQKDTPIEDVIELLQFLSGTRFEILRYPDSD